jgi:hypothetical protein
MAYERLSLVTLLKTARKPLGPLERALYERARWVGGLPAPILAPARYRNRDWSIAGRAFDYWLRAHLALRYNVAEAETVVESLLHYRNEAADRYLDEATITWDDGSKSTLREAIVRVVKERRDLMRAGSITCQDFFENCINFAMYEGLYRSGDVVNLSADPALMVEDLRKLGRAAAERNELFAGASVDLNPQFRHRVFAADGDFAIGERLVDLKTAKDLIPPLTFVQVLSYVLIEGWDRGSRLADLRYREVAVYNSRHGSLGVVDLRDVAPVIVELRSFLEAAAQQHDRAQRVSA